MAALKLAQGSGAEPLIPTKTEASSQSHSFTLDDIKRALREETETNIKPQLYAIQTSLKDLSERVTSAENKIQDIESSITFSDARLDDIENTTIPAMQEGCKKLNEDLVFEIIDDRTHKRKWGVIVHGIDGQAQEKSFETRTKVIEFAREKLKVPAPFEPNTHRLAACHRLSQKPNAAILIRFLDLDERNAWLDCGKNLAGPNTDSARKYSISPDLPPATRPLKEDIS